MKSTLLIAILAALAVNHYSQAASLNRVRRQLVPAEFRNINIDSYLKNPRSVLFQLKCIVYDGPCDRIGKYLKVTIPELITGTCQHCSPSDRQTAGRLVAHIQKNYPQQWNDAIRKYSGGGQTIKLEDANKFESLLGVKLESDLVASSTAAPVTTTTVAPVVVPSSAAPVLAAAPIAVAAPVSSSVAPAVVAVQPAVEAVKPVEVAQPAVITPSEESKPVVVETVVPTENTMSVVV